jgi:hypothetical protein
MLFSNRPSTFVTLLCAFVHPSAWASNVTNGYFSIYSGACTTSSDNYCFYSPNYPNAYGYSESCNIYVNNATTLDVIEFDLESTYDYLIVNGVYYSGSDSPDGVAVTAGSYIYFYSDSSVAYSGFSICADTFLGPMDDGDTTVTVVVICASAICFFCFCYCCCCRKTSDEDNAQPQGGGAVSVGAEPNVSQPIREAWKNNAVPREATEVIAEPQAHGISMLSISHDRDDNVPAISLLVVDDSAWEKNLSGYELIERRLRAEENLDVNATVL